MLHNSQSQLQAPYEDQARGLDLWHYFDIAKKRWLFFVLPTVLTVTIGALVVILKPATYMSQGKILVESQQIPIELVRPTVTATAAARIQVIEQRVMTRDNLLAIANKFHAFDSQRNLFGGTSRLSGTEILDKMRERTQIKAIELETARRSPTQNNTIAFSVSFEHERPEMAMRVANELVTLILTEDARSRTNRAAETTQFLVREQKRLEVARGAVEAQLAEFKRKNSDAVPAPVMLQLATLRAELQQKAAIYSPSHPALKPIKQQIDSLEKMTAQSAEIGAGLEALLRQRTSIQNNLDDVAQKLTIARRGETLERDQQAERLEILEQPIMPTDPVKGKRLKLLFAVFGLAFAAGVGGIFAAETLDRTVRGTSDLASIIDSRLIVGIPYISTRAESLRTRKQITRGALAATVAVLAGLAAIHFLWIPLNQVWDKILLRMTG
jgi:uncharacterized protein involved in exopolysaccharide biosynthesis